MDAPLKRQTKFPIQYVLEYAELGSTVHLDYMSTPFDPPERGTWDEVRAVTDVGWFCYSEERLSTDDHLDRVARAGFQFVRGYIHTSGIRPTSWLDEPAWVKELKRESN
jgi:hypothetical protein